MAKKSRHTAYLEELGFTPFSEQEGAYVDDRSDRRLAQLGMPLSSLTRRERRLLKKTLTEPIFAILDSDPPSTYAVDETGKRWILKAAIDPKLLTERGFKNGKVFAEIARSFPPLPPRKMDS